MKRALFVLLALAVCLSACTPAAVPESEASPSENLQTTDTGEEVGSVEKTTSVAGTLRSVEDCQSTDNAWYSLSMDGQAQEDGTLRGAIMELDYTAARQKRLFEVVEDPNKIGDCFAWGDTVYYNTVGTGAALHAISLQDGSEQTISLPENMAPAYLDDQFLYLVSSNGISDTHMARMDRQTGELETMSLPSQTSAIQDTDGSRFLLSYLISEQPINALEEGEQAAAALQNAMIQYAWWDPATGALQNILKEPFYGEKNENGQDITRIYLGRTKDSLYFFRMVVGEGGRQDSRIESCPLNGGNSQVAWEQEDGAGAPGAVRKHGEAYWLVSTSEKGVRIYNLATGTLQEVAGTTPESTPWPWRLTEDDRVLVNRETKGSDGSIRFRLIPEADYLAGNFTGTDVTPAEA